MNAKDWIRRLFNLETAQPEQPVAPGLYHYMRENDGTYTRFHLRVEPDASGLLLANATSAARLSASGAYIAKSLLDGRDVNRIATLVQLRFSGAQSDAVRKDIDRVQTLIEELAAPGDNYPIINLDDTAFSAHAAELMAPFAASVPLAEPERSVPIIDRLWEAGIPHVLILAPANPNAAHLVRAVERAEDTGMIAGVRARASDLQGDVLKDMAQAGLDYITLPFASTDATIHDALLGAGDHALLEATIAHIYECEVAVLAEAPLVEATLDTLDETLEHLSTLGVNNVSFFAIAATDDMSDDARAGALKAEAMRQAAAFVEESAHRALVRFIWEPPLQRIAKLSLVEQVRGGPRCSGDVAVRVEPDGSVIPPRGPYRSAGNLLTDDWQTIWRDTAFRIYRERVERPTHCEHCPGLVICAADCPRETSGWSQE